MKEQILSPVGQDTHPARREAILIGWMHARNSEENKRQETYRRNPKNMLL